VKNIDVSNQYLEHIREVHDPSLHVKTLEDEIRGTMGKALGRQGEKILYSLRLMQEERDRYNELVQQQSISSDQVRESAERYNNHRQNAVKARWELMVHRQAVGFVVNNHKFVHEKFPIDDPLPVHDPEDGKEGPATNQNQATVQMSEKKNFGDQRDWWQRIGRWK
jgi:hypothetical protein